jgi:salicylate hydroxylase
MQAQGRWQEAAEISSCIEPVWSGTIAYRALIPADRLKSVAPGHQVLTTPTQVFNPIILVVNSS